MQRITDERIRELWKQAYDNNADGLLTIPFARLIEAELVAQPKPKKYLAVTGASTICIDQISAVLGYSKNGREYTVEIWDIRGIKIYDGCNWSKERADRLTAAYRNLLDQQ